MSNFENYKVTSEFYNSGRMVPAPHLLLGQLMQHHKSHALPNLSVGDCGCGTGNYSVLLLQNGVGRVVAFDASEGMLRQSQNQVDDLAAELQKRVTLSQCKLPDLPADWKAASLDAVMFNEVLHHLAVVDKSLYATWEERFAPFLKSFINALAVLRPGGQIYITTSTTDEYRHVYWFTHLIPERVLKIIEARYPSKSQWIKLLKQAGFKNIKLIPNISNENYIKKELYYDMDGPQRAEWRALDSIWALLTDEELAEMKEQHAKLRASGRLQDIIEQYEDNVLLHGRTLHIVGEKE